MMEEDEAALLAELKAISSKSATSRFDQDDQVETDTPQESQQVTENTNNADAEKSHTVPEAAGTSNPEKENRDTASTEAAPSSPHTSKNVTSVSSNKRSSVPPWKRGKIKRDTTSNDEIEIVVASPSKKDSHGQVKPWKREENQEASDSYSTGDKLTVNGDDTASPPVPALKPKHHTEKSGNEASSEPQRNSESSDIKQAVPSQTSDSGGGFPTSNAFNGERGGAAQDAELLALLKGISANSGGSDRFADHNDDTNNDVVDPSSTQDVSPPDSASSPTIPEKQSSPPKPSADNDKLPPWKRKNKKPIQEPVVDVVIAAPPAPTQSALVEDHKAGFKSSVPSTFQGELGGAAEDPELLAELMAVSSGAGDRFAGREDDDDAPTSSTPIIDSQPAPAKLPKKKASLPSKASPKNGDSQLPPWKRKCNKKTEESVVDVVVAAPPPSHVQKDSCSTSGKLSLNGDDTVSSPRSAQEPKHHTEKSGIEASSEPQHNSESSDIKQAVPSQTTDSGGGFPASSTFNGERGGAAQDAELLALLKGISANSGGSDRFADHNDETNNDVVDLSSTQEVSPPDSASTPTIPEKQSPPPKPSADNDKLPPWKRKNKKPIQEPVVDVVVAAPPAPSQPALLEDHKAGFKSSVPSTFQGELGGAAEDPELLAELMAVSSGAGDRFAGREDDDDAPTSSTPIIDSQPAPAKLPKKKAPLPAKMPTKNDDSQLPPWKRKRNKKTEESVVDVVVAAPPTSQVQEDKARKAGFTSSVSSTFKGERGGSAEDAELLAELMAVSSKSGSGDRFASNFDESPASAESEHENAQPSRPTKATVKPDVSSTAPTQVDETRPQQKGAELEATTPVLSSSRETHSGGSTIQSPTLPSTFTGDRGGEAIDAELLAELRAISSSGGGGAFENNDEGLDDTSPRNEATSEPQASHEPDSTAQVDHSVPNTDVPPTPTVEAVEPEPASSASGDEIPIRNGGFKSSMPSTFVGDRGGAAEDAELLAELRAISAQSGSSGRFSNDTDEGNTREASPVVSKPEPAPAPAKNNTKNKGSSILKPWKRRGKPKEESVEPVIEVASKELSNAEASRDGFKSSLPSTFRGDRGGAAEDPELLRELLAASGANSDSRFRSEEAVDDVSGNMSAQNAEPAPPPSAAPPMPTNVPSPSSLPPASQAPPPFASLDMQEEVLVTRESLPSGIIDKKWKVRKQSYDLLGTILSEAVNGKEATGDVISDSILNGLDEFVVKMVADSNASALDSALKFAYMYADNCNGAASADQAAKVVDSMVKGSAFSSSRPSTAKLCVSVTLKFMEVGTDGVASVHAVVDSLLSKGLTSKKPKVVLAAVTLILDAANNFGAGCLPLAAVASNAQKMLSHSNAKVRDTGMKIIAEICRATGSKAPLQDVIDNMKSAQLSQLDGMLDKQPKPHAAETQLRSMKGAPASSESSSDILAALEAGKKEQEAKRLAARPAVNIFQELLKTDYSTRILLPKWSEKVGALNTLLQCGGEIPYKLVQPSSSANYVPLIGDMKKLLSHTHFAVCAKAMEVLSMFASGVGERLFPNLRPLLSTLLQLSKDKKLTNAVASCLDAFFGNILSFDHLLEKEGAVPSELDERKQKNTLVRSSSLGYLQRCVKRNVLAGPRGKLSVECVESMARLCCEKAGDSDAGVRKAVTGVLDSLLCFDDADIRRAVEDVVESELKTKHPRVYKALMSSHGKDSAKPRKTSAALKGSEASEASPPKKSPSKSGASSKAGGRPRSDRPSAAEVVAEESKPPMCSRDHGSEPDAPDEPPPDDALAQLSAMGIPEWAKPEDEGGVQAGLKSSKWLLRQNAIKSLATFCGSGALESSGTIPSGAILAVVKAHTKGFRETNVNVTKAVMELFVALCGAHEKCSQPICSWACRDGATLAAEKIADRKLSALSDSVLTNLCVVRNTESVSRHSISAIEKVKSPLPHEALLKWYVKMLEEFGASTIRKNMKETVSWLLKECGSTNLKVRNSGLRVVGELHSQLGPAFKALSLSLCSDASVKSQLDNCFSQNPFDGTSAETNWARTCLLLNSSTIGPSGVGRSAIDFDIPKADLESILPAGCISRMGSKDGKTAWKVRKEAMDEVSLALEKCNGLISTNNIKFLADLLRALRERLSDSQSNLKPVAAKIIGSLLAAVDKISQARLGKLVYAPLVSAVMNDNRKPMREAALKALSTGTQMSSLEGGGTNALSLEPLMIALVSELNSSEFKGGGIPDMLLFVLNVSEFLPNMDSITVSRAQSLGEQVAAAIVKCLTSSKSETRSSAETLLKSCIENGSLSVESVNKGTEKLLPAQKRTVTAIISRLQGATGSSSLAESDTRPRSTTSARTSSKVGVGGTPSAHRRKKVALDRSRHRPSQRAVSTKGNIVSPPKSATSSESGMHPLLASNIPSSTPSKERRLQARTLWPEHPEEPNTASQLNNVKKLWSPILPSSTVATLFPTTGITKQEHAKPGCELLARSIQMERSGSVVLVVEQLDLILKWISFSLCSRENTVGLQSLLSLLLDLFQWLQDQLFELSVEEANLIVPYVYEKSSTAKGRFLDQYTKLLSTIKSDDVLPPSKLGPLICIPLIERTQHSKTRVLAYRACLECVEKIGLNGISKKGVLVTAKALSEETLPESRSAALDLMEAVLTKMNGDIKRLARICGASNLSDKAKDMLEERWRKNNSVEGSDIAPNDRLRRRSHIPSSKSPRRQMASSSRHDDGDVVGGKLPALQLRLSDTATDVHRSRNTDVGGVSTDGPFSFSFQPTVNATMSSEADLYKVHGEAAEPPPRNANGATIPDPKGKRMLLDPSTTAQPNQAAASTSTQVGAAALLRARLLKIRDKHKSSDGIIDGGSAPDVVDNGLSDGIRGGSMGVGMASEEDVRDLYSEGICVVKKLLHHSTPVYEQDKTLVDSIAILEKFHRWLENNESDFRTSITVNSVELIDTLGSVIGFAFRCDPQYTAGISVRLLSAALATLIAFFRDERLAAKVSQEALTLLFREAGTALLDSRLAKSTSTSLDEATSSQLVRAINRLLLQAASGSPRHTSFQALLALQLQLCSSQNGSDFVFNKRLSRVVTRLFAKVVQAENDSSTPYRPPAVDTEAILCSIEDFLVACTNENNEQPPECANMAKSLVTALLVSRKDTGGAQDIRGILNDVGINSEDSKIGLLLDACEAEAEIPATPDASNNTVVATLVSNVGRLPEGPERTAALEELRRYKDTHGEVELNAHLQEVSATFRAYILEQLSTSSSSVPREAGTLNEVGNMNDLPMSERIKHLKSRLHATEAAVQSAVEVSTDGKQSPLRSKVGEKEASVTKSIPSTTPTGIPSVGTKSPARSSPTKRSTNIPTPGASSLRQRLAAAQQQQRNKVDGQDRRPAGASSSHPASSFSHAAALRARLEAVKNQGKRNGDDSSAS